MAEQSVAGSGLLNEVAGATDIRKVYVAAGRRQRYAPGNRGFTPT
ncbi:hypothetical protein [Streptomyces sp. NPDC053431]